MSGKEIGEFLKKKRLEKGLSVRGMSKQSGLSRTQIGDIEKGEHNWTRDVLMKYLKCVGLRITFLKEL